MIVDLSPSVCVFHRVGIDLPVAVTSNSDRIRRHNSFTRPLAEVPLNGNIALNVECYMCVYRIQHGVVCTVCTVCFSMVLYCNGWNVSQLQFYPNPRQMKILRCV